MSNLRVKIINRSGHSLPSYSTDMSAGVDIRANIDEAMVISPGERVLVPTGLFIEVPAGYEAQIRPRGGLALKEGIIVPNTPGTIDADYRGEIQIILINLSDREFVVNNGDRICQMVFSRYETVLWEETEEIDRTARGEGAFGHTGIA